MFEVNQLGVITQDTSQIKEQVENAYKVSLGETLNTEAGTPQGQLIINDTELLKEAQAQALDLCNSFSLYTAEGQELDVAGGFFGYIRKQQVATVVQAILTGTANTLISQGSIASDGTNNYILQEDVIIGSDGTATGTFQCEVAGAIPCLANTLTEIITTTTGWDSVNNVSDGIVGYATESDNTFRQRATANWLNIRAKGIMGSIIDAVAQVDNVISAVGNENYTNTSQVIDGITMQAHSIYLCVLGGNTTDIAKAIYDKKTNGTGVNGNTKITYYDSELKYSFNYLIYRPTFTDIYIQVNYKSNNFTTPNISELLENAIQNYFANNPFMIGQTISNILIDNAFENFNQADILSIKISLDGETWQDYITLTKLQVAVIKEISINKIE